MADHFRLFLDSTEVKASLIGLLRRHTGKPISELRNAIAHRRAFIDEVPHHNQYSEFIARVTPLLDELDAQRISYSVELDGLPESPEYLRSVFQRWEEIGEEVRRMSDLESGEPCIETLEWLKRNSPAEVFQQTLKLILESGDYACDEKTVAWARSELSRFPNK